MMEMANITPFLWFNDNAEEAAKFYLSIFKDSAMLEVLRYGEEGPGPKGGVMYVTCQIDGQKFIALNGGPAFSFSSATSFFVECKTQKEVDDYWEKLSEGGEIQQCGWLKDTFGVTWQILPAGLNEVIHGADAEKSKKVFQAMLQMKKLDIDALRKVYEQG
jgi:predicted 3-demethylubiquinone-9 3-methyltransferase (glyoxalase superfamily)